jgi:hypothetical protein
MELCAFPGPKSRTWDIQLIYYDKRSKPCLLILSRNHCPAALTGTFLTCRAYYLWCRSRGLKNGVR